MSKQERIDWSILGFSYVRNKVSSFIMNPSMNLERMESHFRSGRYNKPFHAEALKMVGILKEKGEVNARRSAKLALQRYQKRKENTTEIAVQPPMHRTLIEQYGRRRVKRHFLPFPYVVFILSRKSMYPTSNHWMLTVAFANEEFTNETKIFLPPLGTIGPLGNVCIHVQEHMINNLDDAIKIFWETPFRQIDPQHWPGVAYLEGLFGNFDGWAKQTPEDILKANWPKFLKIENRTTITTLQDMIDFHKKKVIT